MQPTNIIVPITIHMVNIPIFLQVVKDGVYLISATLEISDFDQPWACSSNMGGLLRWNLLTCDNNIHYLIVLYIFLQLRTFPSQDWLSHHQWQSNDHCHGEYWKCVWWCQGSSHPSSTATFATIYHLSYPNHSFNQSCITTSCRCRCCISHNLP